MVQQAGFNTLDMCHMCVCVCREQGQRSEESSSSVAAGLHHQTLKQSPSQHSFDSAILDGSLPDESLSVDSDVSDSFFAFMDSGIKKIAASRLTSSFRFVCRICPVKKPMKGLFEERWQTSPGKPLCKSHE